MNLSVFIKNKKIRTFKYILGSIRNIMGNAVLNKASFLAINFFQAFTRSYSSEDPPNADYYSLYQDSFERAKEKTKNFASSEAPKLQSTFSHVDDDGKACMVDVGSKMDTPRKSKALAKIILGPIAFPLVKNNALSKKGDVLSTSRIAGIMGAKKTSDLIPLCHSLSLSNVQIDFSLNENEYSVDIVCSVKCFGKTGVEMEALTGASIAALAIYDMCKAVNQSIVIQDIKLLNKIGGKSNYSSG